MRRWLSGWFKPAPPPELTVERVSEILDGNSLADNMALSGVLRMSPERFVRFLRLATEVYPNRGAFIRGMRELYEKEAAAISVKNPIPPGTGKEIQIVAPLARE